MATRIGTNKGKPPCLCARFAPVGQRSLLHPEASVVLGAFSGTWAELVAQIEQIGGTAVDVAILNDSMNEVADLRAIELCVPGSWVTANGVQPVLTVTSPIGTPQLVRGTWSAGACKPARPEIPECVESQEYTYGIDNSGTRYQWASACYRLTLSDGTTLEFEQTTASNGNWTDQLIEWGASVQSAANNAGLLWFVEPRFVRSDAADLSGGGGFPGPPSEYVQGELYRQGMRARYLNIQICPGQPVPVRAELIEIKDAGSAPARAVPFDLTATEALLGPIQKFQRCIECGDSPEWYAVDGVTPLEPGQIPNCWEPCGTLSSLPPPPERACAFEFADGCDNNGQDITDNFTQGITRRRTICNGEITGVDYFTEDEAGALVPHDMVGILVDCESGEPVPAPAPPCPPADDIAHRCIVTTEVRTVKWQSSDFDPGDAELGDQVTTTVSLAADDPAATYELVPCPGYTFTETSPGNWTVAWIWNGTTPAPKRLEARVTLSTGEVYTVKDQPDFATYSGGDGSTEAEFKGRGTVKELCYINGPNLYQNEAGEKIERPEFCDEPEAPPVYIGKLWRFRYALEGARVKYWQPAALGGSAVPHDDIDAIFTGDALEHPNAPSHEGIVPVFSFSTASAANLEAIGIDDRAATNGTDQLCLTGFVNLSEAVTISDDNANTGERGMFAYRPCCSGPWQILSIDNTSSVGGDAAAFQPSTLPGGLHEVAVYTSDASAWQGLALADANGDRLPTYADKPGYLPPIPVKCYADGRLYNAATGERVVAGEFDRWCAPPVCGIGTLTECA